MPALDKLAWSVRALAQPSVIQKKLFPSFVVVADELALEFEEHYAPTVSAVGDHWSSDQMSKLRALDQKLEAMSGSKKEDLWLSEDSLSHSEWSAVRSLAKEVLLAFGWPTDEPPPSTAIYVSGKKKA
jgi:hypothetical protein